MSTDNLTARRAALAAGLPTYDAGPCRRGHDSLRSVKTGMCLECAGAKPARTTVIEIIREHLVKNGFDGLVQPDAECGCLLDELHPCGENFSTCKPGYRHARDNSDGEGDWVISTSKTPPVASEGSLA